MAWNKKAFLEEAKKKSKEAEIRSLYEESVDRDYLVQRAYNENRSIDNEFATRTRNVQDQLQKSVNKDSDFIKSSFGDDAYNALKKDSETMQSSVYRKYFEDYMNTSDYIEGCYEDKQQYLGDEVKDAKRNKWLNYLGGALNSLAFSATAQSLPTKATQAQAKNYAQQINKSVENANEARQKQNTYNQYQTYLWNEEYTAKNLETMRKNKELSALIEKAYEEKNTVNNLAKQQAKGLVSPDEYYVSKVNAYNSYMNQINAKGYDANSLLDTYTREQNRLSAEEQEKSNKNFADKHPVMASVGYVGANALQTVAVPEILQAGISNAIDGDYTPMDTNTPAFAFTRFRNTTSKTVSENIQKEMLEKTNSEFWSNATSFAYQTGLSIGDFASLALLPEPVSLTIMGTSAGVSAVKDASDRGVSADQALLTGLAAGAAELIFEKISLENFNALKASGKKGVKNFVLDTLKQSFTEGSEEVFTDIANVITDQLINGSQAELSQQYYVLLDEYNGDSEKAWNEFAKSFGLQLVESYAGGALSGGVMGTFGKALNHHNLAKIGKDISKDTKELNGILDVASTLDTNTYSAKLADKVKKSKNVTNSDIGELYVNTVKEIQKNFDGAENTDDLYESYTNIVDKASGFFQGEITSAYLNSVKKFQSAQQTETENDSNINEPVKQKQNVSSIGKYVKTEITPSAEISKNNSFNIPVLNMSDGSSNTITGVAATYNGDIAFKTETGDTVSLNDIELLDNYVADVVYDSVNLGANGASVYIKNAVEAKFNSSKYQTYKDYSTQLYNFGVIGSPWNVISKPIAPMINTLGIDTAKAFYNAGVADTRILNKVSNDIKQAKKTAKKTAQKRSEGEYNNETDDNTLDALFSATANKLGLKLNYVKTLEKSNGYFLQGSAESFVGQGARRGDLTTFFHENLGEYCKAYNHEAYKLNRDNAIQYLTEKSSAKTAEDILNYYRAYVKGDAEITIEDAKDELYNDFLAALFTSPEGMQRYVDWLMEDKKTDTKQKKNILETLKDFIKNIFDKLSEYVNPKNFTRSELEARNMEQQQADKFRTEILEMVDGAITNFENGVEISVQKSFSVDSNLSVKEQLQKYSNQLQSDDTVAQINTSEYNVNFDSVAAVRKFTNNLFADIYDNGGIKRTDGKFIEFTNKLVNKGLNYLKTQSEKIALLAVPNVIQNGRIISERENHKGRNYSTYTIAAPIEIDGMRGNVAVVVTVVDNGRNRYKVHRILFPNGSKFEMQNKNGSEQGTYRITNNDTLLTNSEPLIEANTSINSISNSNENVKKFSLDVDITKVNEETTKQLENLTIDEEKYNKWALQLENKIKNLNEKAKPFIESAEYIQLSEQREQAKTLTQFREYKKAYSQWAEKSGYNAIEEELEILNLEKSHLSSEKRNEKTAIENLHHEYMMNYVNSFSNKQINHYISEAKQVFGTTKNFKVASYITPDGSMLDFGDGSKTMRNMDHREISGILDLPSFAGYSDGLLAFMNMGNIRIVDYSVDITKEPTAEQYDTIRRLINSDYDRFFVDVSNNRGYNNIWGIQYSEDVKPDTVISDIDNYFKKGTVPEEDGRIRFSKDVDEYSKAVNEGNINKAQELVDKKAIEWGAITDNNGKPLKLYHGTTNQEEKRVWNDKMKWFDTDYKKFTIFKKQYDEHVGHFFNSNIDNAGGYGSILYEVYLRMNNPLIIDCNNANYSYITYNGQAKDTYEWAEYAKNNGYDGVIFKNISDGVGYEDLQNLTDDYVVFNSENIKSADAVVYDNNGNVIPLAKRFSKSLDIRYSIDVDDYYKDDLLTQNAKLKKAVEYYRNLSLTTQTDFRRKDVRKIALQIKRDYGSNIDTDELTDSLLRLYTDLGNDRNTPRETFQKIAKSIARDIVYQQKADAAGVDYEVQQVLDDLKTYTFTLSEEQRDAVDYYMGSMKEWCRSVRKGAKYTVKDSGLPLEAMWQELSVKYPQWFDADTADVDMPVKLLEITEALNDNLYNDLGMPAEEYAEFVSLEIFKGFDSLRPIETIADKEREKRLDAEYALKEFKKESRKNFAKYKDDTVKALRVKWDGRIEKQKEVTEKRRLRRSIEQNSNILYRQLVNPNKQRAVPDALREPVLNMLSYVNFESGVIRYGEPTKHDSAWQDKFKVLAGILEDIRSEKAELNKPEKDRNKNYVPKYKDLYIDIPRVLTETIRDLAVRNEGKANIYDMNLGDLESLAHAMTTLRYSVSKINELHREDVAKTIQEAGDKSITEIKDKRGFRNSNVLTDFFNFEQTDFFSFTKLLGDTAGKLVGNLFNKGFQQQVRLIQKTKEFSKEWLHGVDYKTWTGNKAELKKFDVSSGTIYLTPSMVMSLYLLNKRGKQALDHIQNGGIVLKYNSAVRRKVEAEMRKAHKKVNWNEESTKKYKLSSADISNIISSMTAEQKSVADKAGEFLSNEVAAWGNDITMEMYLYKAFNEKNYFPIETPGFENRSTDANTIDTAGMYRLANPSFSKHTIEGAETSLYLDDMFEVFARHVNDMINYNAYTIPISNAMKWLNYDNGETTVKEALQSKYGVGAVRWFTDFLHHLNGDNEKLSNFEKIANQLLSNTKVAAVGANLRVAIQQGTAYEKAAILMKRKYLRKALVQEINVAEAAKEAKKYCPIVQWKSWGFFETDVSRSMQSILLNQSSFYDNVKEKSMILAELGDEVTWAKLWTACKLEIADTTDLKVNSPEFYQATADRLTEIINATQVVDSVFHRSALMRRKNLFVKSATAFMNEPTKSYNMLRNAVIEVHENPTAENKKKLLHTAYTFVLTQVLVSLASALVDGIRHKGEDDKSYLEKLLEYFGKNLVDNINPLNMMPGAKDIMSMIDGWDVGRMDMTAVSTLFDAGKRTVKRIQGDSKQPVMSDVYSYFKAFSQFSGIPVANAYREVESIINLFTEKGLRQTYTNGERYQKLYEYKINGDQKNYDKIYKELQNADVKENSINSGIKSALTENDIRVAQSALAYDDGDMDEYINLIKQITADGFEEKISEGAVSSYYSSMKTAKGYLEDGDEEKYNEYLEKLMASGIEQSVLEDAVDHIELSEKSNKISQLYSKSDLITALDNHDVNAYDYMYNSIVAIEQENGKSQEEAEDSVKKYIANHYKKEYISNKSNRSEIESKLNSLNLFDKDDYNKWISDSYDSEGMVKAFEGGLNTTRSYVQERVQARVNAGSDSKKAQQGIKQAIANNYKEEFINGNANTRAKIITYMTNTGLYGNRNDVISYINKNWFK